MRDKSKPIRVLHIVGGVMDVGGIEMFLMNYYRHIDRNLIQFDFCIVEEGNGHFDQEIRSLGGVIYNLPSKKRQPINHLKGLLKVLKEYQNYPVHMHLDGMNGLYGLIAFLKNNKIRISHSHNTNHLTNNPIKRFFHDSFRLLNRVVNNHFTACSNDASLWLHGKSNSHKSIIIRNAIDTKKFAFDETLRNQYRGHYGITDEIVIGHVGRLHPQKNHRFILNIAMELKALNVNFKIVFVGDGELHNDVETFITKNELSKIVIIVGKTDTPEVYYNMFDLFILPSLFEGLGISLIEAQSNGLPCLVSENIPAEAILSSRTRIIPLDEISSWVNIVLDTPIKRSSLNNNPYEISMNLSKMVDYYKGILRL
jgi:glycosyltransferase involved in cell wall biosynthesis